jgi:hypothetical protein
MSSLDHRLGELLRPSATQEVRQILGCVKPADLDTSEILGLLAILRVAMARVTAANAAPAPLILLRPKSARVNR